MSTISSLSSSHLISSQLSTNPNNQLIVCVSPTEESKQDFLPTPLITPQNSNSFDHDDDHTASNINSQDLIRRLCLQKSRLIQLYDCEIARQQPTSSLFTFLDSIDQLVNEYENYKSTIGYYYTKILM